MARRQTREVPAPPDRRRLAASIAVFVVITVSVFAYLSYNPRNEDGGDIAWGSSLDAVLARSGEDGLPVMVDFYTEWCTFCTLMDREVYSDWRVANTAQNFICVKVDGDRHPELIESYGIEGYPTVVFLDGLGIETNRVVGYQNADQFLSAMNECLNIHAQNMADGAKA